MHRCRKIMLHEFYSTSCWAEGIVIDATYDATQHMGWMETGLFCDRKQKR